MNISKWALHRLHMSPISSAVRRTPLVRELGVRWWVREQSRLFIAAVRKTPLPVTRSAGGSDSGPELQVPSLDQAQAKLAEYTDAGEAFSAEISKWCSTSKFESISINKESLGYQDIYAVILKHLRDRPLRVLEVGIGINDPTAPSGMTAEHKPGASLEGWYGYFPGSEVHGADVDRRCLVDTDHYTTHFVDQLDSQSLSRLATEIGPPLDLIVDDGLHTPEANANTVAALLPLLSPSGVMVVEDISSDFDELWFQAQDFLPSAYKVSYFPSSVLRQYRGGPAFQAGIAVISRTQ